MAHESSGLRDERGGWSKSPKWIWRSQGVGLIVSGAVSAPLVWIVLRLLERPAAYVRDDGVVIGSFVEFCLRFPAAVAAMALGAIGCGVMLVVAKGRRWIWLTAGLPLLVAPVITVLVCFVGVLRTLYQV